jgi:hypothetical protein
VNALADARQRLDAARRSTGMDEEPRQLRLSAPDRT